MGFALVGVAGLLFALSGRKDGRDEDETDDKLEEGWVDEVMGGANKPEEAGPIDGGEEAKESDEPQQSPSEVVEQETEPTESLDDERDAGKTEDEGKRVVFSTPNGKTWHVDKACPRLSRSKNIRELKMGEATEAGMKPCGVCGK